MSPQGKGETMQTEKVLTYGDHIKASYAAGSFAMWGNEWKSKANWLIAPCKHNRDSDTLTESNWSVTLSRLAPDDYEIVRFGHWACGWYEIVIVRPDTDSARACETMAQDLADYPVLDESHYSDAQCEAADHVWKDCYSPRGRIEYIRENRDQFDFRSFADLLGCVRGRYFAGYASDLLDE
jgi:hypothetical protein